MNQRKAIRLLMDEGFWIDRIKKHVIMKNKNGITVIVPNHREIDEDTWKSILRQAGIG
jgi:predicted RNA binding protein YcfA (HicA-like mRNA interferase family)